MVFEVSEVLIGLRAQAWSPCCDQETGLGFLEAS